MYLNCWNIVEIAQPVDYFTLLLENIDIFDFPVDRVNTWRIVSLPLLYTHIPGDSE